MWGSILLLALLNNALPFALFGWGQTHIASGLASILNATTPIWGVVVAHFLTHDERMSPRKIAGVLLGFGGVATMIGPALLSNIGSSALAQLACVTASLSYALAAVWARRFRRHGLVAAEGHDRPADRRRADDAAAGADRRPAVDPRLPAAHARGARSSRWLCCAPRSATCSISG